MIRNTALATGSGAPLRGRPQGDPIHPDRAVRTRPPPSPEPSKTRRLFLSLRHAIASGDLGPGARLPSEAALGERWGVSRVTVRRALHELELEGLIVRRAGAGTFVAARATDHARPVMADLPNLLGSVRAAGRSTSIRVISSATVPASDQVAQALGLAPAAPVLRCERVRMIDGQPFSYLLSWTPAGLVPRVGARRLNATPIVELMEGAGVTVRSASQTLVAQPAAPEVAQALGVSAGVAVIGMTRLATDADGRPVEYLFAAWHPTRAAFQFELERVDDGHARHWEFSRTQPLPRPTPGAASLSGRSR